LEMSLLLIKKVGPWIEEKEHCEKILNFF